MVRPAPNAQRFPVVLWRKAPTCWPMSFCMCLLEGLLFFLCCQALLLQGDNTTDAPNMLGVVFETHQGSRLVDGTLLELSEKQKLVQSLLDTLVIATAVVAVCWTPMSAAIACARAQPKLSCESWRHSPEEDNLDFRRRGRDSKTAENAESKVTAKGVADESGDPDAANASVVNEIDRDTVESAARKMDRETDTGDEFKDEKRLGLEGEARQNRAAKDKNRGIQEDIERMQRDYNRFVGQVSGLVRTSCGRDGLSSIPLHFTFATMSPTHFDDDMDQFRLPACRCVLRCPYSVLLCTARLPPRTAFTARF